MAVSVQFEPVPATTGILLFTLSMVYLIVSICSSWESVDDSPVVPQIMTASVPSAICSSRISPSFSKFTSPFSFIGVTIATPAPLKIDIPLPPSAVLLCFQLCSKLFDNFQADHSVCCLLQSFCDHSTGQNQLCLIIFCFDQPFHLFFRNNSQFQGAEDFIQYQHFAFF